MLPACLSTMLFTGAAEPADVPANAKPAATSVAITILRMRFSSMPLLWQALPQLNPIGWPHQIILTAISLAG